MSSKAWLRIFAWFCTLVGIALIIWQLKYGGWDWLLNAGIGLMVTGWVLRAYLGYKPLGGRKPTMPRKPPGGASL
jgi:hypothetical protein